MKSNDDWKDQVEKEKAQFADTPKEAAPPEELTFAFFLSTLAFQAYAALGEIEDPQTGGRETNLDQAKYVIDILGILREKTKGNLSPEEDAMFEQVLYETRLKYVEKKKGSTP